MNLATLFLMWNCFCCGLVIYSVGSLAVAAMIQVRKSGGRHKVRVAFGALGLWLIVFGAAATIFEGMMLSQQPTTAQIIQNTGLGLWNMVVTLGLVVGTARALVREVVKAEEATV